MKSVMQEASSIAKAVEQAWLSAGKPLEFSIKVLEEPQKNFLGFSIRSAKVALFFDIAPIAKAPSAHRQPKTTGAHPQRQQEPQRPVEHYTRPQDTRAPENRSAEPREKSQPTQIRRERKPLWTDAMVAYVTDWISQILKIMHLDDIRFTVEPSDFYLRITFERMLLGQPQEEKKLFASFATLIIESLRHTFKTGLKGHKIILSHTTQNDTHTR